MNGATGSTCGGRIRQRVEAAAAQADWLNCNELAAGLSEKTSELAGLSRAPEANLKLNGLEPPIGLSPNVAASVRLWGAEN